MKYAIRFFILLSAFALPGFELPKEKSDSLMKFADEEKCRSDYAILIDMSIPSDQQRLFLVNLTTRKCEYQTWVAHGRGSGRDKQAKTFSDKPRSLCTSLGKYKVGKNYTGKHGDSYELIGLEKTNAHAMSRSIVIHSAKYVEEAFIKKNKRCGNSWGCPAVSAKALKKLKPFLKEGMIVWIYK